MTRSESTIFQDQVAYHDYEGIAVSPDEKKRLVADLGGKPVMILRNHGLLTVGRTPGQAFLRMFYLERSCEIQVDALAGGTAVVLPPEEVRAHTARQFQGADARTHEGGAHDASGDFATGTGPNLAWDAMMRLVERVAPDYKD